MGEPEARGITDADHGPVLVEEGVMTSSTELSAPSTKRHFRVRSRATSEHELLVAWRTGDRWAGDELLRRHWRSIHDYFRRRVGPGEHEELAQQTLVACMMGRARIRETSGFDRYVHGVARNILRVHLRRASRAARTTSIDLVDGGDRSTPATLELGVDRQWLLGAMDRLDAEDRRLLRLCYWEQLSSTEIGCMDGVSGSTVRCRVIRARSALWSHLVAPRRCGRGRARG